MTALTVTTNLAANFSLQEKFKAAAEKKVAMADYSREFLQQFLSVETKTAYTKDLLLFFSFLAAGDNSLTQPADIKAFHFQLYRDHLLEQDLASATVTRRMVAVRSFVKWAVGNKLMEYNPLDTIKLPKVQTESPTVAFDDEEVSRMINTPDTKTHRGRTARLVLSLLFNLGLRRTEVVTIKLADIFQEREHTLLKIHGKGDKVRLIPISSIVAAEIESYINYYSLGVEDYLVQSEEFTRNTKPMDGATVYRIVIQTAAACGITKKVSPHSCRATTISYLLDTKKADIRAVADLVGHTNTSTTQGYDKRRGQLDKSAAYLVEF